MTTLNLPCACKKQHIYTRFSRISIKILRPIINDVVAKNRAIELAEAKLKRSIFKNECREIMIAIGEYDEDGDDNR